MATEYESKIRELLSTLGTSQAPWAKALLKTVQSKNISLSEWNTALEKLAEASNNGDTLANAFLALPLETLEQLEVVDTVGESETAVMSQAAATRSFMPQEAKSSFVNINEDGSASVGAPTSGESAINAYALKRHLSRHSTLYPSKEENGVTVYNKLKFVMPADDTYFAMVGDHSADNGTNGTTAGENPKVSFDTTRPVYIPSVVPAAQYEGYGYSPVPVDLPVHSIRIGAFQQNRTVRSVVIQEGVARIEANAFDGCKQLTSIVLADTIKMIDNNAFNNAGVDVKVENIPVKFPIKLPKALEYICQQAFNNVNVCGSIVFPNRCLYIGGTPDNLTGGDKGRVFTSPYITQIVFEGTPKYIHGDAFSGCKCDIYVPWSDGKVKGAPWGANGTVHYNSYPDVFPNGVEIVQEMGERTTAVMSQKAVTNALQSVEALADTVASSVNDLRDAQDVQNEKHEELAAKVEALEEGGGSSSSVEVVQSTGTSTEAVMSQDATTKQLNNKVTVGSADMAYPVLYGRTPSGYYGGGAQKMYKISDTNYAPSSSSGDGALVKWYGYGTSGQILNQNAPKSSYDLSNKAYVDAVYRHDITLVGGFEYPDIGDTTGYMACTVYSRKSKPWDLYGFDCTLTGRTTATGIINIEGTEYTIVGLEKGDGVYHICYTKQGKVEIMGEEQDSYIVEKFKFYDGTGTFTDTVTKMI